MSGPIPLHRYRAFKRGKADERADRIRALADQLGLPISALAGDDVHLALPTATVSVAHQPFDMAAHEYHFASVITAKLAIADDLARPLAKLAPVDRTFIDQVLSETLNRSVVLARVRDHFRNKQAGENHAG